MGTALRHGPITTRTVHLCLDMQRLFSAEGPWATPWMHRVLPAVVQMAGRFPERTVFTRFIPPLRPDNLPGTWRRYYTRWRAVTRECIDPGLLDLVPPLAGLVPPATVINKQTYSAFMSPALRALLVERQADGIIVSGAETDVCVLATVLGAVDWGYRVILASDALCSSSDAGHDALIGLYRSRFSEQVETADCESILSAWQR